MDKKEYADLEKELKDCKISDDLCLPLIAAKDRKEFRQIYKEIPKFPLGWLGAEKALHVIHGKWKYIVIMRLIKNTCMRYNELKRDLVNDGITDYMLTCTLNDLIDHNLVKKTSYPGAIQHVEYEATDKAIDLFIILIKLSHWYNVYSMQEITEKLSSKDGD